jgi:lysozyme family protein
VISQMQANITLKILKNIQDQKCRLENLEIKSNIEWSVMQIALIHAPFFNY